MADQRQQPFRFRLPWLPGGPVPTPAPATAPAPAPARPVAEPRPPRPATAGPSRPPFRPAGVAPTQPTPRPEVPSAPRTLTEPQPQTSIPKPTSPRAPKTEQPSKPLEPTGPRIRTPEPRTPTPEVSSVNRTIAESQTSIPKPTLPPKTEPPSKPLEATGPRITTPEPKTTASKSPPNSPPKPPRQSASPRAASQPPSPSRLTQRPKPLEPNSSTPASPQKTTPTKPEISPKREPSPTIISENASNTSKLPETIQKPSTSTSESADHNESKEVQRVPDEKNIIEQEQDLANKPDTVLQPISTSRIQPSKEEIVHKKEMITTSKAGKSHNHKPFGEKAPLQKEIKEDISKFVHKLGIGHGKQPLEGDKQLTVITLAGENRGASMTLSNVTKKRESSIHIRRGYRINPDENIETSTDGEESSKGKGKLSNSNTDEETTTKAYINSNVQGINNSLLFHGSVSTKNPGVRYVRSHTHPETSKGRHEGGSYETLKAECSGTQSEMLAYAPNVKKRCLRSLMLESSDSDPEKPQRHGCRYGRSKDKKKDKNIGVL